MGMLVSSTIKLTVNVKIAMKISTMAYELNMKITVMTSTLDWL